MPTGADHATAAETFEMFVAAINSHNLEVLTSLMTADHLFVDSLGNRVRGAESMQAGWQGYFAMCPDYLITISKVLSDADTVIATGEAGGTIDNATWKTPAAWRATIRGRQVAEWCVYADNRPVYEILARPARQRPKTSRLSGLVLRSWNFEALLQSMLQVSQWR